MYCFGEGWIRVVCSMTHTLVTSPGRAETELILTVPHTMSHVIWVFNCIRGYASMTIVGELDAFWCPLQIEIINKSKSWYTTDLRRACTEHEGDHSFKAAATRPAEAWKLHRDCQGCVLRIITIQSIKWQCLLQSNEITTARGPSSVHQTEVVLQSRFLLPWEAAQKAAYLLCTNQPLQVIKLCFCICSTTVLT